MRWGGVAYYPSKVLPVAPEVAARGDQIAACLAACRKYGLEVHVWKVNFNAGRRAPAEFVERMRREGRLQQSAKGQEDPWLCPSHPENQALEVAAMVEVAREYGVDGVHFDYIRYPDGEHCFCAGCRERFGRTVGTAIARWPADALAGDAGPVAGRRSIGCRARGERAGAGGETRSDFGGGVSQLDDGPRRCRQDWKLWCDRGWLDFVCPMNYTGSARQFGTWVAMQKWASGRRCIRNRREFVEFAAAGERGDQAGRDCAAAATRGFILFNYGGAEVRVGAAARLGTTAKARSIRASILFRRGLRLRQRRNGELMTGGSARLAEHGGALIGRPAGDLSHQPATCSPGGGIALV